MPADFTSGVFARGIKAWHGLGEVTTDVMTPDDAFRRANALFPVAAVPLFYENPNDPDEDIQSTSRAIIRTDNGDQLGTVGEGYELVNNDRLLEMANALSKEIEMDAVIVLDEGAKVAFTGLIRGTNQLVLPGDAIDKFVVGFLGHNGKTSVGAAFTNIRAVCANTLAVVMEEGNRRTVVHKKGANLDVSRLINSIEVAREGFSYEADIFRAMVDQPMDYDCFRDMLEDVFAKELQGMIRESGMPERFKTLDDLRIMKHLDTAWRNGIGTSIPGVRNTAWGGFNALTEVLSSGLGANGIRNFNRAVFGTNRPRIDAARNYILALN